jgi:anthranilate phosphoribosyltransferase
MKTLIKKLSQGIDLSPQEMQYALKQMLNDGHPAQTATFLTLLHQKGETAQEILAVAQGMQSMMTPVSIPGDVLDIVGTGGDGFNTVNLSTGAALLAASCGVTVAKHGNRAVSSLAGSADMIEQAGIPLDLPPTTITQLIKRHRFAFLYAPRFHPVLSKLRSLRSQMGIPTLFNQLGPLLNPCQPNLLMIGVSQPRHLAVFAAVLSKMNIKRALVFHCQGLDEICTAGPINAIEVSPQGTTHHLIDPIRYGFSYCRPAALAGGTAADNVARIQAALQGHPGAIADALIFNAGIALYLAGQCHTIEAGLYIARTAQHQGIALHTLNTYIQASQAAQHKEAYA